MVEGASIESKEKTLAGEKAADAKAGDAKATDAKAADEAAAKLTHEAQADKPTYSLAFAIPVHRSITEDAIEPYGVQGMTAWAELKGGNAAQDIDLSTRNDPSHHFDSNRLKESLAYLDSNQKEIDKMLLKPALTLDDEAKILNEFGHRIHTIQDFYAHSNYVEQSLKANPRLTPDQIPLMNLDDIKSGKAAGIHTGYAVKDETTRIFLTRDNVVNELRQNGEHIRGTHYLPTANYDQLTSFGSRLKYFTDPRYSFLHRDINKDDHFSDEGRVVDPYTQVSLHDYARNLAVRATSQEWAKFESRVKHLRGNSYGNEILYQMKTLNYDQRPQNNF